MKEKKSKVYCTFQDAPEHSYPGHPESPKRLAPLKGWLQKPPYPEIEWLDYSPADEADVLLIHRKSLLDDLKSECAQGAHEFEPSPSYVTKESYQAALSAVGATLAISRRIFSKASFPEKGGKGTLMIRPLAWDAELILPVPG